MEKSDSITSWEFVDLTESLQRSSSHQSNSETSVTNNASPSVKTYAEVAATAIPQKHRSSDHHRVNPIEVEVIRASSAFRDYEYSWRKGGIDIIQF